MRTHTMVKEINDAIGAHGMWKFRLRTAIASGTADISSVEAGCDDKCAFGKWIYGSTLDAQTRAGMPYQVIRRLHADFHRTAGRVLAYIERGDKASAAALFDDEYVAKSEKLVRGLTKWKAELQSGTSLAA